MRQHILKIAGMLTLAVLAACSNKAATEDSAAAESAEVKTEAAQPAEASNAEGLPEVIDFNATWCGPCRQFAPTFEKMAEKYSGKIKFTSIDVDENPDMASKYGVEAIPTVVYLDANGDVKDQTVGLLTEADFESRLTKLLE